ncbi:hypothetical protein DEU29_101170 [Idiomarina aquatica]|uniref:Uncharacterized protein n=1 Tax=Idiomarina aquatica TaxID=1327752 RepID=A0A4R6PPJ0_9GAMM|nr:hypothetical protein [Idiomarina aquatica]TDP40625.1 hypothetical protein DEU29_101170 [Idiomarina aquatica]
MLESIRRWTANVPLGYRAAIITLIITAVFSFWDWGAYYLGVAIMLCTFLYAPEKFLLASDQHNKVKNVMSLLAVRGDNLQVGLEQVPVSKLKRVAVGEYDKRFGILQFPFNYQISHSHIFPIQQLDSVREFFKTNYPDVELIT